MARHAPPVRLKGIAPTVSGASSAPAPPTGTWPLNGYGAQGNYAISDQPSNMDTEPYKTWNVEKDLFIMQGLGWLADNVMDAQTQRVATFKNINPDIKILYYILADSASQTGGVLDDTKNAGVGSEDNVANMLLDSDRGRSEWLLKDGAGNQLYNKPQFGSAFSMNMCQQFAPDNNLGRNYGEQYMKELHDSLTTQRTNGIMLNFLDGLFFDVVPPLPPRNYDATQTLVGVGDFDRDGSDEDRESEVNGLGVEANYGGARMYRRGFALAGTNWIDTFKAQFGTDYVLSHNGTEDGIRYDFELADGDPPNTSEFYEKWDHGIHEHVKNDMGFKWDGSQFVRTFNGFKTCIERTRRMQSMLRQDSEHPWGSMGKHSLMIDLIVSTQPNPGGPFSKEAYDYVRFFGGYAALMGCILGTQQSRRVPFPPLDEYVYQWGDPVTPNHPYMGDYDPGAPGGPMTVRAPDFESGVADFYWVEFDNVLWVVRGDPIAQGAAIGTGAAVNCELPNPGTGKKWIHPDLSNGTYTHPLTGFSTRGQNDTLNSGLDVTSGGSYGVVSLTPWTAVMVARADA